MSKDSARDAEAFKGPSKKRAEKIGEQLRSLYDSVAQEDVPEDFLKLLEQADDASTSSPSKSD